MNVLFVDDDPALLSFIDAALRRQVADWTLQFVTSGAQALQVLETTSFDVVVSDLHMPEMDGTTLLETIERRWPTTLRVILSSHADRDAALRAMRHAHQFVGKPASPATLVPLIERLVETQSRMPWAQIRETLGRIRDLPPAPTTYLQLMRMLRKPECTADKVTAIIERDPAVAAKVLKLANSAYFRRNQPVRSISAAIVRLGLSALVSMVLGAETFTDTDRDAEHENLRLRSMLASLIASRITPQGVDRDAASSAALLAEIGPLLLGHLMESMPRLPSAETRRLHAEIGAHLLGMWGLPDAIVVAVANQHRPAATDPERFDVTGVVHVATALARGQDVDAAYLDALDLSAQLEHWQHVAETIRSEAHD